jgi:hypothetical protein
MGFFSRNRVVDLTDEYKDTRKVKPQEIAGSSSSSEKNQESSSGGFFNFFNNSSVPNSNPSSNSENSSVSQSSSLDNSDRDIREPLDANEKRRRLAKRLKDMTDKLEDLSNQTYLLQQRIEVLERKNNLNSTNSYE